MITLFEKDFYQTFNDDSESTGLSDRQLIWITSEKVVIYLLGILLLFMSVYNTYYYLLKEGKYKILTNTMIYVTSNATIISILYSSALIPAEN